MSQSKKPYGLHSMDNLMVMIEQFGRITAARPFESIEHLPIEIRWGARRPPTGSVMLVGFEKDAFGLVHRGGQFTPWAITALLPESGAETP